MLSKELEFTLNLAFKEAREKNHEFMTVEHLLYALLGNPSAVEVLRACGGDLDQLKQEVGKFLEETTPKLSDEDDRETQPTLGFPDRDEVGLVESRYPVLGGTTGDELIQLDRTLGEVGPPGLLRDALRGQGTGGHDGHADGTQPCDRALRGTNG